MDYVKKVLKKITSGGISYISRGVISVYKTYCLEKIIFILGFCKSYTYSRLLKKPLIYVIGDSHTSSFKETKYFIVKPLGPATAFKLPFRNNQTQSHEKLFSIVNKINTRKDIILLVFGEIDCRIHIYNQFKKSNEKRQLSDLINKTVTNYGAVLHKLADMNVQFIVYGVPPANYQENRYFYTFYADPKTQRDIKKEFNRKLMNFCYENNYKYIEVFERFSDSEGFILQEYKNDDIHLNKKILGYVQSWFTNETGISL